MMTSILELQRLPALDLRFDDEELEPIDKQSCTVCTHTCCCTAEDEL
jgi:hypothetical protein